METRCGGLLFSSKFDSGNLARVEKVSKEDDEEAANYFMGSDPCADYEFNVWTTPDAAGTPFENGNRSWFYFGVKGGSPNRLLKINIMNLNRQGKLYSQGHSPLVKTVPGKPRWERIRDKPTWESVDNNFILSFTHRFAENKGATTYFAFCYPWSYEESQHQMTTLDDKFQHCKDLTSKSAPDQIYYHRELICHSLDKLRIDLVTISSCSGMVDEEEPRFDDKLFPDQETPRCKKFKNKKVYLVSSRVHPGETPASFVYNGFLDFILREDDPRARQLRRQYVFKLIPMLNPDGVKRGHYRTDSRGVNLNRMYLDPRFDIYPSIYASKALLSFHHVNNRICSKTESVSHGLGASSMSEKTVLGERGDGCETSKIIAKPIKDIAPKTSSSDSNTHVVPARSKTYNVVYNNGSSKITVAESNTVSTKSDGALQKSAEGCSEFYSSAKNLDADIGLQHERESAIHSMDQLSLHSEHSQLGAMEVSDCDVKYDSLSASNELASGGECEDIDDGPGPHIGNEGSDDEDVACAPITDGVYAPHLSDPHLLEIPPHESGIAFYVDLHAHASKRGCFIYGNYFENEDAHVENLLFPKLVALNTAHFDFTGCNFTERNMYLKDKREGLSKEGAGRVAIMKALGIIHSYTLECNYNTGRMVNSVPPAYGDNGRASPPPLAGFPPKYTAAHFEDVGRALAVAALDYTETNPWSRLTLSEYCSLPGIKDWVRRYIKGQRGLPRGPPNRPQRAAGIRGQGGAAQNPLIPRVALLAQQRQNANNSNQSEQNPPARPGYMRKPPLQSRQQQSGGASRTPGGSMGGPPRREYGAGSSLLRRDSGNNLSNGGMQRREMGGPPGTKKELGPIRDVPRATADRSRRRLSNSSTASSSTSITLSASTSMIPVPATELHHSQSAPVTLCMTTAQSTDIKTLGKGLPPDCPRPFLQSHPPKKHVSSPGLPEQQTAVLATWPGFCPSPRDVPTSRAAIGFGTRTVNTTGMTSICLIASPPGSSTALVDYPGGFGAPTASAINIETESIQSIEEEKVQQLKNIPHHISGVHRHQVARNAKPLEAPKSDPVRRKNKKSMVGKRRSASYSPNSIKGIKKAAAGSGTDSDAEKRPKGHRRRSWAKGPRVKSKEEEEEEELEDIFESAYVHDGSVITNREKLTPSQILPHPPSGPAPPHHERPPQVAAALCATQYQPPPSAPTSGPHTKKSKKKKKWLAEKSTKHKLVPTLEFTSDEHIHSKEVETDLDESKASAFWINM